MHTSICKYGAGPRNQLERATTRQSRPALPHLQDCARQLPRGRPEILSRAHIVPSSRKTPNTSRSKTVCIGVDRMQCNFEPMRRQVEAWRAQQLSTAAAKLTIYRAFIEADLDVPKDLARKVHELYFTPQ